MDVPDHYTIDGVRPRAVETPTSADQVVEILATAAHEGTAVAPVGGGGALRLGNPIERYDVALDMRGLYRILEHQAADLVLSVEAGACLSDISEALARHGQWLPIEAPNPSRATIGGLIATALSGPGRLGHGSLRDYLIGISVVTPTVGLAKAGGMVVKNVSGFDMMRLHHGALGTLGVIVSANFKVLPAPRDQASVAHRGSDLVAAHAATDRFERLGQRPSAVVIDLAKDGDACMTARFDGLPGQVRRLATDAAAEIGSDSRVMVEDESRAWWRHSIDGLSLPAGDMLEIRMGSRPGSIAGIAADVLHSASSHDISVENIQMWPGLGTLLIRIGPTVEGRALDAFLATADATGSTWRITSAPSARKQGRDVWGRPPASLETMRRLKEEFDPGRILNPGRYCGHI